MKFTAFFAGALGAMVMGGVASAGVVICDPSFETPKLPAGGYEYGVQNGAQHSSDNQTLAAPSCSTFSNGAGIQSNGSAWGFAGAPNGSQTAFLQSYNSQIPGQITLDATGLTVGKSYLVEFEDADRPGFTVDPVTVSFSGTGLGTFTPTSTDWSEVKTARFTATSADGTITFAVASNPGDADIGLDSVSLAVPEPMTWLLMIGGVAMIGAGLRVNRRSGATAEAV